jgi:transcription-repair coupling factor (superfamily II helicase)
VQRYVGSGSAQPRPTASEGHPSRRRKEKVERALVDLAAELLEVQAKARAEEARRGSSDAELSRDLVRRSPTRQPTRLKGDGDLRATRAEQAMDTAALRRCGFGKDEVALRAAFAYLGRGQVALSCDTVCSRSNMRRRSGTLATSRRGGHALAPRGGDTARTALDAWRAATGRILIGTHRLCPATSPSRYLGLVIVERGAALRRAPTRSTSRSCARGGPA